MTNEEILKKAIEKAKVNGMNLGLFRPIIIPETRDGLEEWFVVRGYYPFIFSHEFAKAFWPTDGKDEYGVEVKTFKLDGENIIPLWAYHLQQMVLEPEPLKYLEKFLDAE